MKYFFVYCFLGFIFVLNLNSQVVIDHATHAPSGSDYNVYHSAEFLDPGISGQNQVWDYSSLVYTGKTTESQQHLPYKSEAEMFTYKPDIMIEENNNKFFYRLSEKDYSITGLITEHYEINYNTPLTRMIYPFSYTNHIEGELNAIAISCINSETTINGNYEISADAWGTLILPGNIHKNVLRVKQKSSSLQVSQCREVHIESVKYLWYSAEDRYPLVSTIIEEKRFSNGDEERSEATWINDKILLLSQSAEQEIGFTWSDERNISLSVFPNPVSETAKVSYYLSFDAETSLSIYGIAGNKIHTIKEGTMTKSGFYTQTLNANELGLKPGMYIIKLYADNETSSIKFVINQ